LSILEYRRHHNCSNQIDQKWRLGNIIKIHSVDKELKIRDNGIGNMVRFEETMPVGFNVKFNWRDHFYAWKSNGYGTKNPSVCFDVFFKNKGSRNIV
jgi:hypothetical protein